MKDLSRDSDTCRTLKSPVRQILKFLVFDPKMRKRFLITIGSGVLLQFLLFMPFPGLDLFVLKELFQSILKDTSWPLAGAIEFFYGGPFKQLRIFSLGLMPFFFIMYSASVALGHSSAP